MDCVKIFASVYDVKPIGFRLLQYNFVNSSGEPWVPDQLTLYDGDIYNMTTKPLVNIKVLTTFCIIIQEVPATVYSFRPIRMLFLQTSIF